jgi:hypothetical protein
MHVWGAEITLRFMRTSALAYGSGVVGDSFQKIANHDPRGR